MAIVGVIPAAGHATRLQPLSGSKEVLAVDGKPVIDYLVQENACGRLHGAASRDASREGGLGRVCRASAPSSCSGYPETVSESLLTWA